jgi:hypothetical protein
VQDIPDSTSLAIQQYSSQLDTEAPETTAAVLSAIVIAITPLIAELPDSKVVTYSSHIIMSSSDGGNGDGVV